MNLNNNTFNNNLNLNNNNSNLYNIYNSIFYNLNNINNLNNANNSNNINPQVQIPQEPVIPFLNNNGEIISNIKCHEYFRQTKNSPVTSYGYSQYQNARSSMEDEGRVIENLNNDPNKILFLLFDGHGGGQVSKFLQEHFHEYMKKLLPFNNYFKGFLKLFRLVDEDIKKLNCPNTGATGTVVFIEKDKETNKRVLHCANVGNSRCILINKKGTMRFSYDDICCR